MVTLGKQQIKCTKKFESIHQSVRSKRLRYHDDCILDPKLSFNHISDALTELNTKSLLVGCSLEHTPIASFCSQSHDQPGYDVLVPSSGRYYN
ncbi:hypothetical protein AVEN_122135-1 [Araneus ventricosus]|uniref:Uncharacterized protein n=1 Tax=Araneus ventricosus TaxID=182803 RepID=A0A4Y2I9H9_ARAVE|nr:hypothetical protein AVEN_122135-1 [Araneus ventricosus]